MINNFNELSNNINLKSVIDAAKHEIFAHLNCMRIGIIEEILENNEVRCAITNKKLMGTDERGTPIWREYSPVYAKVYYMGTPTFSITYPLEVNTPCLLLFNDREFDSFFETRQVSVLSDSRMHSLTDAICIPLFIATAQPTESIINIKGTTVNIDGTFTVNGKAYMSHVHSNGNQGANTGSIVEV